MTRNNGANPTSVWGWFRAIVEFVSLGPRLSLTNRRSTNPIIGVGNANVSLTTYGRRTATVWKTIETIGAGTVRPGRVILWLEDAAVVANPPRTLKRLQARGLEIRHCKDFGPHKKYFPYVVEIFPNEPSTTLVTADDDTYYPPTWLDDLLAAHQPDQVTAFRARMRSERPYVEWPVCATTTPSYRVFATGVSGVAYPPKVLCAVGERGDEFMSVCPRADDFWLHFAAVATNVPIRQVRNISVLWWAMPIAASKGLWDKKGTANDAISTQAEKAWLGGSACQVSRS